MKTKRILYTIVKIIGIGIGSCILMFIFIGIFYTSYNKKQATNTLTNPSVITETKETIRAQDFIRARDIIKEYKVNEFTANKKYNKSKTLLYGITSIVKLDLLDDPFIELDSNISAKLLKENKFLETIRKGDLVWLLCVGKGEIMGSPRFDKCNVLFVGGK